MNRRKMHSPNKREESKKGKCIEGSTSKSNDINLLCGQPNTLEQIDFKVVPGVSVDKQSYNLDSSLHGKHYIPRHNHQERSILTVTKYDLTLKEWLEQNTNNWCPIYRKWNVNRPTEEAMELIQCILQAVYDLHTDQGIFHGFLHHPENFFIKRGHRKKIKLVYLEFANTKPKTSAYREVRQNDILAISDVIFRQILRRKSVEEYPEDLKDLYKRLSPDRRDQDWTIIVDHPSLWHWKIRFSYIERVWMQYRHAGGILREQMDNCLRSIPSRGWINEIPSNTPLQRMFKHNNYGSTPCELFRYIRIVRFHYRDYRTDPPYGLRWIVLPRESDYLEERFIEHKTTQVCELLLVCLHWMVCKLGIEV